MIDWLPDPTGAPLPLGPVGSDEFLATARKGARQAALRDACDLLYAFGLVGSATLIRDHLLSPPPKGSRGAYKP